MHRNGVISRLKRPGIRGIFVIRTRWIHNLSNYVPSDSDERMSQ